MNTEAPIKSYVVIRRVLELLLSAVILSASIVALNALGILRDKVLAVIITAVFQGAFVWINLQQMRICYCNLNDKKLYYTLNLLSYFIFVILTYLAYFLMTKMTFLWIFSLTVLFAYFNVNMPIAILMFHLIGIVCIFIAPLGLSWDIYSEENDE